ncbi:MAG: hypothetical protein V1740_00445 [Candidatus Woesearchaeota archaeon]
MDWKKIFKITPKRILGFILILVILQLIPLPIFPCTYGSAGVSVVDGTRQTMFGFCLGLAIGIFIAGPSIYLFPFILSALGLSYVVLLLILIIKNDLLPHLKVGVSMGVGRPEMATSPTLRLEYCHF